MSGSRPHQPPVDAEVLSVANLRKQRRDLELIELKAGTLH